MVADGVIVHSLPLAVHLAVDGARGSLAQRLGDTRGWFVEAGVHLARGAGQQVAALEAQVLHLAAFGQQLVVHQAVVARLLGARTDARAEVLAVVVTHDRCRRQVEGSFTSRFERKALHGVIVKLKADKMASKHTKG